MEKQKIRIKDVPYIYLDIDIIERDITEVSANILNIRQNLHLAYLERQKNVPAEKFTPFELYEEIYIKRDYNDLDLEIETKLKVFPFQIMDATLLYYLKLSPESSIELCKEIIKEVKEVNGSLYTLWHNETVSEFRQWKNWKKVFVETIKYSTKR